MTKKLMKEIDEIIKEENECGHTMFKPEINIESKLRIMAECIGVDYSFDEDDNLKFNSLKDEAKVREALDYYHEQRYW